MDLPSVAIVSLVPDLPLALGIGAKNIGLLILTMFTATPSLGTRRTTILSW